MNKMRLLCIAVTLILASCAGVDALVHNDKVIASVGKNKLYRAQVAAHIPADLSPEDSIAAAGRYIDSWVADQLFVKVAEEQLSEAELDISAELDSYRRSLLRYRYEQKYVNDRLDTLVTDRQIETYYDEHKDSFVLERPVLKAIFVDVMKDSPNKDLIMSKLLSPRSENRVGLDSLVMVSALSYMDKSDTWTDVAVFARQFGTDYETMLKSLDRGKSLVSMETKGKGDIKIMYVCEMQERGIAPVEYCAESIRNIILNGRKHRLVIELEEEMMKDAYDRKQIVKY